jgi:hypothetical protein
VADAGLSGHFSQSEEAKRTARRNAIMEMADRVVSSPHLKWWEAESPEKTS